LAKKYRSIRSDIQPIIDRLENGDLPGDQIPGVSLAVFKVRIQNTDIRKGKYTPPPRPAALPNSLRKSLAYLNHESAAVPKYGRFAPVFPPLPRGWDSDRHRPWRWEVHARQARHDSWNVLPRNARYIHLHCWPCGFTFVEYPHKPRQIMQTLAVGSRRGWDAGQLWDIHVGTFFGQVALDKQRTGKQPGPAIENFFVRPFLCTFTVNAHDDVIMVTHHRIGCDIDGKYPG